MTSSVTSGPVLVSASTSAAVTGPANAPTRSRPTRGRTTSRRAWPSALTTSRSSMALGGGVTQRTMTKLLIYFPTSMVNTSSRGTLRSLALKVSTISWNWSVRTARELFDPIRPWAL